MKRIIIRFLKSYIDKKYKLAFDNSDKIIEELNNKLLWVDDKIRELDNKFEEEKEKYILLSHTQEQTKELINKDNKDISHMIELYVWSFLLGHTFKFTHTSDSNRKTEKRIENADE